MKILLFGSSGMLGSAIKQEAAKLNYEVIALSHEECSITDVDAVRNLISTVGGADVIINAAGIIDPDSSDFSANSVGPHNLAWHARYWSTRFIHVSTDCVFSGRPGPWHSIMDIPDPVDLYGVSKRYGEIAVQRAYPKAVIVRTSFIGTRHGLVRWFLDQPKGATISGYELALWSGSSVQEVARRLLTDVIHHADSGIQHLASELPISKYEVLTELRKRVRPDITIVKVQEPQIYRALKPTIVMNDVISTMSEMLLRLK